jgi:formylglycine-generating enzyme required for sulfatase activity
VTAGACTEPDPYRDSPGEKNILCNWKNPGRGLHPVNCVDWWQAASYCAYMGKRLPTEAEREWAARNGDAGTAYPWGEAPPDAQHLNACGAECPPNFAGKGLLPKGFPDLGTMYPDSDGFPETAPVGSFPQGDNRWGVHDLAGNVDEWTATQPPNGSPPDGRIIRGCSWSNSFAPDALATGLFLYDPAIRFDTLGFRCAR